MPDTGDQFALWLADARAGSQEALGRVLDACRNYLMLIADEDLDPELRDKGGASDLVQQTFLEAQTAFVRFQGGTQDELMAWMRKLLRNNLIDFTRRFRAVAKRASGREVALENDDTPSRSASIAAETPSPSGHAMAHERDQALHDAIERLPDDYRVVLQQRYEQGLSLDEIAVTMGRSREAVRKLWARAIALLRQELEDHQ